MIRPLILLLVLCLPLNAFEKLDSRYCISYGDRQAPKTIVEYFSFSCPHCVDLFLGDFHHIQNELIETGQVCWVFHPVPTDLLTVQAMVCLDRLSEPQKRIFLEELMGLQRELPVEHIVLFMERFCGLCVEFDIDLDDLDAIENERAFQSAFEFLKQDPQIVGVPSLEIDGRMEPGALPNRGLFHPEVQW